MPQIFIGSMASCGIGVIFYDITQVFILPDFKEYNLEVNMSNYRILFVCAHNSGRSQMAEAILNRLGGDRFEVESAGLEPKEINPLVLEVMKEDGYDLSGQRADSAFVFFKEGRLYDYVITVCDKETDDNCPLFPGVISSLRAHQEF